MTAPLFTTKGTKICRKAHNAMVTRHLPCALCANFVRLVVEKPVTSIKKVIVNRKS